MPVQLLPGRRWLAVLGSVGQPRDGNPAASYVMLDTDKREITYCRAPYDVEQAAAQSAKWASRRWLAERLFAGEVNRGQADAAARLDRRRLSDRATVSIEAAWRTLWQVSRPGATMPMLMKVPRIGEGEDPAAIVSFEMEQMIMPRLSGRSCSEIHRRRRFRACSPTSSWNVSTARRCSRGCRTLPLPYAEVAEIGVKIATALDDLHRQHVIHLDIKPSNIMFRPAGEAVLLDFGLSHHDQLPDLMQEEFRLPFGTAPYMAPEQLLGIRNDPRSDLFALGVLLYFFSTGVRPFGESETLRGHAPAALARSGAAAAIAARLSALAAGNRAALPRDRAGLALPDGGATGLRFEPSERGQADRAIAALEAGSVDHRAAAAIQQGSDAGRGPSPRWPRKLAAAPIVAVAIDLADGPAPVNDALRVTAGRILATLPSARLACVNVLKQGRITLDTTLDEHGHNKHIDRLVALRHWAEPLKLDDRRLTVHVLEAIDPASAILEFAQANRVDHILIGAPQTRCCASCSAACPAKSWPRLPAP